MLVITVMLVLVELLVVCVTVENVKELDVPV